MKNLTADISNNGAAHAMRSSLESRLEFFKGLVWQDIEKVLELWLIDTRDFLEDPSGECSMEDTLRARGRAEALRAFINISEYVTIQGEETG